MKRTKLTALILCIGIILSAFPMIYSAAADTSPVTLKYYDDRMDVSGMTVEITDYGTPTSHLVGYGVEEGTPDGAVVALEDGKLIACGVGEAKVKLDGVEYEVSISAAPLSVFLLIGQSNMEGSDGNADQSVANEDGQVYSTYGDRTLLLASNAGNFVPSALAGDYSLVNTNGNSLNLSDYPVNMLCGSGSGKKGIDSGLAYEWNKRTDGKVWIVNTAYGGSTQASWNPGEENYLRTKATMEAVYATLQTEIAAGHYTLDHLGYFWCQGESDSAVSAEEYVNNYLSMHNSLKEDLAFDHDADPETEALTLEFGNILTVRAATDVGGTGYRQGTYEATDLTYAESYCDLQMTGPRVALYWMAANKELSDINVVSNLTEKWVTLPDGTNGVGTYFKANYPNGRVDYPVQTEQAYAWYAPTRPVHVHPTVHHTQIGYNEIGRDAAKNTCILLGESEPDSLEASVTLLSWDGYTEFDASAVNGSVGSHSLAVPVAEPVYCSKNIEISLDDGLTYNYFDLTGEGSISVSCLPIENKADKYRWEYSDGELVSCEGDGYTVNALTKLSGTSADGALSSAQYKMSRNVALSASRPWAVEWKAEAGEYMLFSSAMKASSAGAEYLWISKNNNGISLGERTTAYNGSGVDFSDTGLDITESHVYRLVNVPADSGNTVYLYVDGVMVSEMTDSNTSGTWSGETSEWLSGKDFLFNFIGGSPYTISGKLEYIEVNEGVDDGTEDVIHGDIDGDGEVSMLDIYKLKLFLNQKSQPTEYELRAGDIDGDGSLTMIDSYRIKYRVVYGVWGN